MKSLTTTGKCESIFAGSSHKLHIHKPTIQYTNVKGGTWNILRHMGYTSLVEFIKLV